MQPKTLPDLLAWLEAAPAATLFRADDLRAMLAPLAVTEAPDAPQASAPATWRERIWTVPPEMRIGVTELAEALGRPVSFVYRHTSEKATSDGGRLPHRRLDGELQFVVGEIRTWIRDNEEIVERGRPALSITPRRSA